MSLTESLIAMAIMAITLAISAPSLLRARETYELQSAARIVESRMQLARILAVTRNRDCRINVTSPGTYAVECQGAVWESLEIIALPRGITVSASARPEFHQRGTVAPTATVTVWDRSGRNLRVIVNVNGRVRVQ